MAIEFLTIDQVSDKLGIHPKTVRRYINSGKISAQKIGGAWRINPESLDVYLDSCESGHGKNHISKDDFCIFMDSEYFDSEDSLQVCSIVDCYVSNENVKELLKEVMSVVAEHSLDNKKSRFNYVYDEVDSKIRLVFWGTPSFMYSIMSIVKEYE
jgi:excisionase family DNA binding protein